MLSRVAVCVLALAGVLVQPASAQVVGSIVGRWTVLGVTDEKGDPVSEGALTLTFTKNGVLQIERAGEPAVVGPNAPDPIRYRIVGNRVVLFLDGDTEYGRFRFEKEMLIIVDRERGLTMTLKRLSK